jgi:phosphoglycerate dehydrogenase-like enzyme
MKVVYLLPQHNLDLIYGPDEQRDIAARVELAALPMDATTFSAWRGRLDDVDAIFSGWGMARMDAAFFEVFPNLKVLFYGAGAVSGFVTDEVWSRGVQITNANMANGVAVAEYTVAQIVLCLKRAWRQAAQVRALRQFKQARLPVAGTFGSTVGIVSLGAIGRMVAERLRSFDVRVIAYDPFATLEQARALNVALVTLDALFSQADVITCHTPWLPETEGLLHGGLFRQMKPGASFINTARGAVVNEADLVEVLRERDDLFAVLDVTYPEPPAPDSPLYDLPNVVLTPHIAGSMNAECRRMGRAMVEELERWLRGEPLRYRVGREYARARG